MTDGKRDLTPGKDGSDTKPDPPNRYGGNAGEKRTEEKAREAVEGVLGDDRTPSDHVDARVNERRTDRADERTP